MMAVKPNWDFNRNSRHHDFRQSMLGEVAEESKILSISQSHLEVLLPTKYRD